MLPPCGANVVNQAECQMRRDQHNLQGSKSAMPHVEVWTGCGKWSVRTAILVLLSCQVSYLQELARTRGPTVYPGWGPL